MLSFKNASTQLLKNKENSEMQNFIVEKRIRKKSQRNKLIFLSEQDASKSGGVDGQLII